jgi:hypothetical protein
MVSTANDTLALAIVNAGSKDWTCSNKRATRTTPVFGVIPWDASVGAYAPNAYIFA